MKRLSLLASFLFLISTLYSQTGWMWQNPDPQGNQLMAVSMKGTHWAVGEHGTVIHRVLPGDFWELVDIGTTENLNDIDIFSISKQGWIVGDNGTIFYTEDNGVNWVQQNSGVTVDLHSVSAINDACVWACGENGTVLKSLYNDGAWEEVSPPQQLDLFGIHSYHCNEAWAVGEDGFIISTENGGQSWTSHYGGTSWDLFAVSMSEYSTSRACGRSGIILSKKWNEDNWVNENESLDYWLNSMITGPGQSGYAVGSGGMILRGTDGGWVQKETGCSWELNDIASIALEDDTYQVVGQYGIMLKNDGYDSEFEIVNDLFWHWVQGIQFANRDTGWAVGGDPGWGGTTDGMILSTTDGGENWVVQKSLNTPLNALCFVNETDGWAVGEDGIIMRTITGGAIWGEMSSPLTTDLTSVFFIDEFHGWAVGDYGEIIFTENGGNSWTKQSSPTIDWLYDVYFVNGNEGWAVGTQGTVIHTTNHGQTWVKETIEMSQARRLSSVHFYDPKHGLICGMNGMILYTNDWGANWSEVESGTTQDLYAIMLADQENAWAVGHAGTIIHSADGGETWAPQTSNVASNTLASVFFIDAHKGWVGGEGGTILNTIHGGSSLANTVHVDIQNNSGTEDGSAEYPFNTVAEGIDAAVAGDSVLIHPGEYLETPLVSLDMKDGLIIVGEDSANTVIAIPFYTGELTMKYYTEISGLTCPGYNVANGDGSATLRLKGCHVGEIGFSSGSGYTFVVEDCTIDGYVTNSSGNNYLTVRNNRFTDGGIMDTGGAPECVEAHIIENNEMSWFGTDRQDEAVIEATSTSITIKGNIINVYGPGSGLLLKSGSPTRVIGNTITMNNGLPIEGMVGIDTKAGEGVVSNNTITGGWIGYNSSSGATLFENNNITNAHTGFFSNGAEKVENNLISNCSGNGLVAHGLAGPIQNNIIVDNDSSGIVIHFPVDLGGGDKNGDGRNTLQNNGHYDLHIKYQPIEKDTLFAKYNLWDHASMDEILSTDILNEGGEKLTIDIEDFLILPLTPDLEFPLNNSTEVSLNIDMLWHETAVSDYYQLQMALDESFMNIVTDTNGLTKPEYAVTLLPETDYYWRVRSQNPLGNSEWSETWTFTTGVIGIVENEIAGFIIYPNPASSVVSLQWPPKSFGVSRQPGTVEIFDLHGRKLLEKQIPKGTKEFTVDVSHLNSGLYFCRVRTEKGSVTKKLMIQR